MTSPAPRGVLSLDTPDGMSAGMVAVCPPSADLLDRALVGFERFAAAVEAQPDE
ncbi:hypothetical protein ACFWP3_23240 [Streptomyces sp. NPDC058525]|uniref:hypothetical protein n=1 Tax=unclassified Streptomyces TaxID=2593676 RepID=UPI00366460F7